MMAAEHACADGLHASCPVLAVSYLHAPCRGQASLLLSSAGATFELALQGLGIHW